MRRFLSNLVRDFRTTKNAPPARRAPRRANLQLEALDERVLLSGASLSGSTLSVVADPGTFGINLQGHVLPPFVRQINFEADAQNPALLDVSEGSTPLGQFPIASIKNVFVDLAYLDNVNVIDSNGLPFAHGTTISLSASTGTANSLNLTGTRSVSGNEVYAVGAAASQGSSLLVDNLRFDLTDNIGSVADTLQPEGGSITISTAGQNVSLSGSNGVTQTLNGLGQGGGGRFTYGNVSLVSLNAVASNASIALDATAAAAGEHSFFLSMFGTSDAAFIQATPSTVTTAVDAVGNAAFVNLQSNSGPVSITGQNPSTTVNLGEATPNGLSTTAGINANVSVSNAGHLLLADNGNTTTQENVQVTESTITGLFGNSAAQLNYNNINNLAFLTGQEQDTYTFSGPTRFVTAITVDDYSRAGLSVTTDLNGSSGLALVLNNNFLASPAPASLTINAAGAAFSNLHPPLPSGIEEAIFAGGLTSAVEYNGFTSINLFNSVGRL